jgi:Fe-S cluster assembly iron-binding protein IscA
MEGARDMIQVTERARETFKNRLEDLIERPGVVLRIGPTDSGLGIFPDTRKDDDQIIEHDGRAVLLIDQEVSETLADTTIDVEEHADGARFAVRR